MTLKLELSKKSPYKLTNLSSYVLLGFTARGPGGEGSSGGRVLQPYRRRVQLAVDLVDK